ncbi:hypothetical protein CPB83DRAFT_732891, partial [Crepidotus variabilis]
APVQHLVKPQNVFFSSGYDNPSIYQGPPTPERERAWKDLYRFAKSRIPESSAERLVHKTVPIPGDKDHYIVVLDVFHQLHCLHSLRRQILYPNATASDTDPMGDVEHTIHCIEALRQALMCSVDITPMPWKWDAEGTKAELTMDVQHTCRNFDAVREWAKEHRL